MGGQGQRQACVSRTSLCLLTTSMDRTMVLWNYQVSGGRPGAGVGGQDGSEAVGARGAEAGAGGGCKGQDRGGGGQRKRGGVVGGAARAQHMKGGIGEEVGILPSDPPPPTCSRTHVHTHMHTHAPMHAHAHTCAHACMHTHTHAYMHARTQAHSHACFLPACPAARQPFVDERGERGGRGGHLLGLLWRGVQPRWTLHHGTWLYWWVASSWHMALLVGGFIMAQGFTGGRFRLAFWLGGGCLQGRHRGLSVCMGCSCGPLAKVPNTCRP